MNQSILNVKNTQFEVFQGIKVLLKDRESCCGATEAVAVGEVAVCKGFGSDATIALGVYLGVNSKGSASIAPAIKR